MIYPVANLFGEYSWLIILIALLLLFGGRVPEVMRGLGQGIVEFKKGMHGIEDEIDQAATRPKGTTVARLPANQSAQASIEAGYKFDPYTGKPLTQEPAQPQMRFDPYTGKPLTQETAASGSSNGGNLGA